MTRGQIRRGRFGLRALLLVVALVVVLPACDGDDDGTTAANGETTAADDDSGTTATDAGDQDEPAGSLKVTTIHLCSETHLGWAVENELFADQGIDVELVTTEGAVTGLAAVLSDATDLSTTNPAALVQSVNEGFPVKLVAGSFTTDPEGEGSAEGVVVAADSDIGGPGDFAGRSIAVSELGSLNHIATRAWVRDAGVDPSEVEFVGLPFPELTSAVLEGRVDGALMVDSQVARVVGEGSGEYLGNPLSEVAGPLPIAAYFASDDFIEANSELVEGFRAAMDEAVAAVNDPANREEVLQVMSEWCERPVEDLQNLRFKEWQARIDPEQLNAVMDLMVQEGYLDEPLELSEIATDGALGD